MKFESFDGYKHAIEKILVALGAVNRSYLAGFLGVTERSLSTWESLGTGEETPKSKRLKLLYEVLKFVNETYPHVKTDDYRYLLENGRITLDPDDDEDGSVSLLNLILTNPDQKYWVPCVKEAVEDFLSEEKIEEYSEPARPVQHA